MLEKIKYINHINESLDFGTENLFVNENDLRDFAWAVTSKNDKISGFRKGIVSKTIPIIVKCQTEEEGLAVKNRLFEVFEKDVLAVKHGKLFIGEYFLRCYVTGSKKSEYLKAKNLMIVKLTVKTDCPDWIKESKAIFNTGIGSNQEFLDYPFDYSYDFKNELGSSYLNNTGFVPVNFRITIYGHADKPTLYIAGHEYSVDVEVGTGEYLVIDSVNKTIILTKYNGEQVNCFNLRNKDSYIFEKIPVGNSVITSPGKISFDITLLEERGEPKWI